MPAMPDGGGELLDQRVQLRLGARHALWVVPSVRLRRCPLGAPRSALGTQFGRLRPALDRSRRTDPRPGRRQRGTARARCRLATGRGARDRARGFRGRHRRSTRQVLQAARVRKRTCRRLVMDRPNIPPGPAERACRQRCGVGRLGPPRRPPDRDCQRHAGGDPQWRGRHGRAPRLAPLRRPCPLHGGRPQGRAGRAQATAGHPSSHWREWPPQGERRPPRADREPMPGARRQRSTTPTLPSACPMASRPANGASCS